MASVKRHTIEDAVRTVGQILSDVMQVERRQ